MSVKDNLNRIMDRINNAALAAGRDPKTVRLLAVTKFVDIQRIAEAADGGVTMVGENRVQEFLTKEEFFNERKLHPHIIGQLQSNKVKYVIGKVDLIHSVDRLSLASTINTLALSRGIVQDVLLEINIADEPQKGGISPVDDEIIELLTQISAMPGLRVRGLMCVPPASDQALAARYFSRLRMLSQKLQVLPFQNVAMDELSMGMSGDFEAAIQEGSTIVRIGSALFGPRT